MTGLKTSVLGQCLPGHSGLPPSQTVTKKASEWIDFSSLEMFQKEPDSSSTDQRIQPCPLLTEKHFHLVQQRSDSQQMKERVASHGNEPSRAWSPTIQAHFSLSGGPKESQVGLPAGRSQITWTLEASEPRNAAGLLYHDSGHGMSEPR